jgi:hypothetical protein
VVSLNFHVFFNLVRRGKERENGLALKFLELQRLPKRDFTIAPGKAPLQEIEGMVARAARRTSERTRRRARAERAPRRNNGVGVIEIDIPRNGYVMSVRGSRNFRTIRRFRKISVAPKKTPKF